MRAREENAAQIPLLEWIAAAIGFALVAATLGFLAWRALTQDGAPPLIALEVQAIEKLERGYLVRIRAVNTGGRTAAEVKVEGAIKGLLGTLERSEATFDYLPPRSPRRGGLYFLADPREHKLELRAQGYRAP